MATFERPIPNGMANGFTKPEPRFQDIGKRKFQESPVIPTYVLDDVAEQQQPTRQRSSRSRRDPNQPSQQPPSDTSRYNDIPVGRTRSTTEPRSKMPRTRETLAATSDRIVSDPVRNSQAGEESAADRYTARRTSGGADGKRASITERSPLQKLEGRLDDISKEEKRARVREAELATERRLAQAKAASSRATDAFSSQQQPISQDPPTPIDIGDLARSQSQRQTRTRDEPRYAQNGTHEVIPARAARDPQVRTSEQPRYQTNRTRAIPPSGAELRAAPASIAAGPELPLGPQPQYRDSSAPKDRTIRQDPHPLADVRDDEFAAAQLPAHYGPPEDYSVPDVGRSGSKKLQKRRQPDDGRRPQQDVLSVPKRRDDRRQQEEQPYDGQADAYHRSNSEHLRGKQQLQTDRMGKNERFGLSKSGGDVEERVPREEVRRDQERGPAYQTNPQTQAAHDARRSVDYGGDEPEYYSEPEDQPAEKEKRTFSNMFGLRRASSKKQKNQTQEREEPGIRVSHDLQQESHPRQHGFFHHHDQPKPRVSEPFPDDWKRAQTLSLLEDDLDLDAVKPVQREAASQPKPGDKAWWEKPETERRRSGSQGARQSGPAPANIQTYDGNFDERSGQTYFSPQLYLKCGPLLRFTGVETRRRSTPSKSGRTDQEIWRGSIMIVTVDSKSSYQQPPVLRLFKQPIDLLPPPPAEIGGHSTQQHLRPEYVDPVAGQIKLSRVGKTLYVKPVEELEENKDLSRIEDDRGLFTERREKAGNHPHPLSTGKDGEKLGKVREIAATRLYADRGFTFWKFKLEIELGKEQARIAYRINRGPAVGFWVPARGQMMNMMFHSCNGFSLSVKPDAFSGPDPMWRDVLNTHQFRPFHAMIGGGDQLYCDAITVQTTFFREWAEMKNPHHKRTHEFSPEMHDELEAWYLNRYAMWFSQGLFGMANSQIPMVNIWDDHDIIDGFGSYPHHTMASPVFTGLGAVAFKYYMLFQHQSAPTETEREEPSWLLGASPGPYIEQLSRSVFMHMGRQCVFLGIDCRTERMRDSILCQESWDRIFDRCRREIVKGVTKHLIVLLGVPIAYPRLNFLENVLTSRAMDPLKALGRTGMLGGFVNKFDGGIEILDDLDDHWTAKHHKQERNYFIQELQEMAAEKSVRVTILGGDVHLAAIGQFYSNKKYGLPKDRDHRYMPNIISSAIVNTPPGDSLADVLNKRNKVHHLDDDTDEDMIGIFFKDVDGKKRNNIHLMPKRNWCSIREYHPHDTPPPTPPTPEMPRVDDDEHQEDEKKKYGSRPGGLLRTLSGGGGRPGGLMRRFSKDKKTNVPPISYYNAMGQPQDSRSKPQQRRSTSDNYVDQSGSRRYSFDQNDEPEQIRRTASLGSQGQRPNNFHRRPTFGSVHDNDDRGGHIDLSNGLDVRLNVEAVQGDPAGITQEYRLIVPALDYRGPPDNNDFQLKKEKKTGGGLKSMFGSLRGKKKQESPPPESERGSVRSFSGSENGEHDEPDYYYDGTDERGEPRRDSGRSTDQQREDRPHTSVNGAGIDTRRDRRQTRNDPQTGRSHSQRQREPVDPVVAAAAAGAAAGAAVARSQPQYRHDSENARYDDRRHESNRPQSHADRRASQSHDKYQSADAYNGSRRQSMDASRNGYTRPSPGAAVAPQDLPPVPPPGAARTAQMPTHLSSQFKPQTNGQGPPTTTAALVARAMAAKQQPPPNAQASRGPPPPNGVRSNPSHQDPRYPEPDYHYQGTDNRRDTRQQDPRIHHSHHTHHQQDPRNARTNHHDDRQHRDSRDHRDHRDTHNGQQHHRHSSHHHHRDSQGRERPVTPPGGDHYDDDFSDDDYTDYDGAARPDDSRVYDRSPSPERWASDPKKGKGWKFWQR